MDLVGRQREREVLVEALLSPNAELIAVYGRRRVGKTFLVRAALDVCFELVGTRDGTSQSQLRAFTESLARLVASPLTLAPPQDWQQGFEQLRAALAPRLRRRKTKQVVFFDELPWLASRRSGFLTAFEHFWNAWGVTQPNLVVVICGSSASWMLEKVVRQRGGLHNRVTRRLRIEQFSLAETELLLRSQRVELGRYQTIELYMALGGIPAYLAQVRPHESAAQAIDRLCFARDGFLAMEFDQLYAALFDKAERHEAIIRALASHPNGLNRGELLAASKLATGGATTKVLDELEESGFILQLKRLGRTKRDTVYWLADHYSLFYLRWVERHRSRDTEVWLRKQGTPAWRAWTGLAFEAVCLQHVGAIKRALGISGIESHDGSWALRDAEFGGAQIDLVIDRADRSANLCEMKFSESEFVIDKKYARELEHKRAAFRTAFPRKAAFLTLVTTYGVRANEHAQRLGIKSLMMDALFVE